VDHDYRLTESCRPVTVFVPKLETMSLRNSIDAWMIDEFIRRNGGMIMKGENGIILKKKPSQCHFDCHKSYMD
jgi:hypothetical protein